ncbi:hypothetical protein ART_1909 [Arthrobacter sp. PAMC 25486]|nr:hypothetical protein ART_1909 [Arthrobacter sp. PAMC 25486]
MSFITKLPCRRRTFWEKPLVGAIIPAIRRWGGAKNVAVMG